jgi:hypothetical protein
VNYLPIDMIRIYTFSICFSICFFYMHTNIQKNASHLFFFAAQVNSYTVKSIELRKIYDIVKGQSGVFYSATPENKSLCFHLLITGDMKLDFEMKDVEIFKKFFNGFKRLLALFNGMSSFYMDIDGVPRRSGNFNFPFPFSVHLYCLCSSRFVIAFLVCPIFNNLQALRLLNTPAPTSLQKDLDPKLMKIVTGLPSLR